ncbi:SAF domain-containing protein [Spongiactinospora sp. TRM90649]|uniref:SAF domain-containing protein n=1 Tax=Spongiactinospora sp. TRM90649 TaxID=3031114 RepID=UPI0023F8BBDA|nr:SAF domain-containing protein [Spongiactinospora sp. TRM90649]MDF5759045.1 SAF domain-containing protein [Spongiactinospora sp. TRM90649]
MLQRLAPAKEPGLAGAVRPLPNRRNPMLLAASVGLTALGALIAWQLYGVAGHRTPVLVMARDVPIGQELQAQDLRPVALGLDAAVQALDASGKSTVIGRRAAVDLKAGSLLSPAHVTDALVPAPGQVIVPVALKPSQLPARGIQSGDQVMATAVPAGSAPADHPARVDRVGQPDADGLVVVDLVVPATDGTALARQAAEGKIAIVLQSRAG